MEPEVTTEEIERSAVEMVLQARAEEAIALPPVMAEIQGPVPQEITQEIEAMPEVEYSDPRPDSLPEPEPGEIIMTRSELGRSRKPWIKDAKFTIYTERNPNDGLQLGWWRQGFSGYTAVREQAGVENYAKVMTLNTASKYWLYVTDPTLVPPPDDPAKPKRKCVMVSFLGSAITNMIKLSPKNETFRAKLMATIGEMPPKDCDTFDKIKDWVEFNFPKTKEEIAKEPLRLRVTFRESEHGRCNYSRDRTATATIKLTEDDFEKALEQSGDEPDFDDVASNLSSIVEEKAQDNVEEYMGINLSTSDEEAAETNTDDYEYQYATMKSHLREYIRKTYPDQADGMGLM